MKFVKMRHAQDLTVVLLTGHAFTFENGEPVDVPASLVKDVMKHGAGPVQEAEMPETEVPSTKPTTQEARVAQIVEAITAVIAQGDQGKLDSHGRPKVSAVALEAGFKVTMDERDEAFAAYQVLANDT